MLDWCHLSCWQSIRQRANDYAKNDPVWKSPEPQTLGKDINAAAKRSHFSFCRHSSVLHFPGMTAMWCGLENK